MKVLPVTNLPQFSDVGLTVRMIGCANGFEKWISGSDRDLLPGADFCW